MPLSLTGRGDFCVAAVRAREVPDRAASASCGRGRRRVCTEIRRCQVTESETRDVAAEVRVRYSITIRSPCPDMRAKESRNTGIKSFRSRVSICPMPCPGQSSGRMRPTE